MKGEIKNDLKNTGGCIKSPLDSLVPHFEHLRG